MDDDYENYCVSVSVITVAQPVALLPAHAKKKKNIVHIKLLFA
jgi:hypothetical protein